MKTYLPLTGILLAALLCNAQSPTTDNQKTNTINVATPNASALIGQYLIPIDYYKGVPEIRFSLHKLSLNGLEVPIDISYDASGIKVLQPATWIGLGWNLSAGGVITRSINGTRDEQYPSGYMYAQNWSGLPMLTLDENALSTVTNTFATNATASTMLYRLYSGGDVGPDLFQFSFNGESGKFYFDRNGNIKTDSKYNIEYTLRTGPSPGYVRDIQNFTITTGEGTRYKFSIKEDETVSSYGPFATTPVSESNEDTAWFLESITSSDGLSKVTFSYNSFNNSPDELRSVQSREKYKVTTVSGSPTPIKEYLEWTTSIAHSASFLNKVETDADEIILESSTNSQSNTINRRLNKIRIRSKLTGKEWWYRFEYLDYDYSQVKFMLQAIYRGASGLQQEDVVYQFDYNTVRFPAATGNVSEYQQAGIDHWGYYNGQKTPFRSLLPSGEAMNSSVGMVTSPDRTPNAAYAKTASLEKITLPTKGIITLEYQNNDYGYVGNVPLSATKNASGLRISKITYKDDTDAANDIVKTYSYASESNPSLSSGVVPFEPVYNYTYTAGNFSSVFWLGAPLLACDVEYSQVIETSSDGSKVIYRFNSPIEYPPTAVTGEIATIIHADVPTNPLLFAKSIAINNSYLKTDNVNTHFRGLLRQKVSLDNGGNLLKREEFTYQTWNVGKLFYYKNSTFDLNLQSQTGLPAGVRTVIFLLKSYISIDHKELSSEVTVNYKPGNPTENAVVRTYLYNTFYYPKEIREERSDRKIRKQILTYPTDYSTTAMGGAIESLVNLIMARGKLIESLELLDGKIVGGNIIEYDGFARPIKELQLETDGTMPYNSSLLNPANHISLPGSYKFKYSYRYNSGRLSEMTDRSLTSCWQWGYNNSKVIAKVENAAYNNIYYDGFEVAGEADTNSKSGIKSKATPYSFTSPSWFTAISNSKLTYWFFSNNQWNYKEVDYSGGPITITDGTKIDELRIFPRSAIMTTYNHDGGYGISHQVDVNNKTNSFEYDWLGRLQTTRDNDKKITKQFKYHLRQ